MARNSYVPIDDNAREKQKRQGKTRKGRTSLPSSFHEINQRPFKITLHSKAEAKIKGERRCYWGREKERKRERESEKQIERQKKEEMENLEEQKTKVEYSQITALSFHL